MKNGLQQKLKPASGSKRVAIRKLADQ